MMAGLATFDSFRDLLTAYRLPRVVLSALELDLFTTIGSQPFTISQLASAVNVSERGLDILCRNLAMSGLLKKRGNIYRNSPVAATCLNAKHPAYRGEYLELLKSQWSHWSHLTESVRIGLPVDHDKPEGPDYRRQFTWAMHHRSVDVATKVASQVDLKGAKTFLDLGGGPATYALAFLARNRQLHATVCDRPAALEVAKEITASHKAGDRLSYLSFDFMQEPIAGQYEVVWYSNVLHIYSAEENRGLFSKILRALTPGGRLIIQDAFLHDREGLFPAEASLFAVTMLLFTEGGNTYAIREIIDWLRQAGYVNVKPIRMKKKGEDWDGGLLQAMRHCRS
jgi:SAM-dependent methyltransferase